MNEAEISRMDGAGIYGRYSCEQQRETSIEDQIRRCREVAERHNLVVPDALIFSDAAMSGTAKHTDKREGYKEMLASLEAGSFDVLIVDEFSRLTRDPVEQAMLMRRFENNQRIRLITADGLDTAMPNWQLQVGLMGIVGQQAIRDTKHRVVRGMLGQLERGYMIAAPAFGYKLKRVFDGEGNRIGSLWEISPPEAGLIEEIFRRRGNGQSMHQIARWLNDKGVPLSRVARAVHGGIWRAARVKQILSNPIYKGEFMWNNSTTLRSRAKKLGRKVEPRSFPRPELRLISDELWHRCNENRISRTGYGGGKHWLAGLIECGCCGAILVLSASSRCRSVYCATCTAARSMSGNANTQTSTIATDGVHHLLEAALRTLLTPNLVAAFRERLRERLIGDNRSEIQRLASESKQLEKAQERLSRLLVADDDPILAVRYEELKAQRQDLLAKLEALQRSASKIDPATIDAQLKVDPARLIPRLFDAEVPPEQLRSVLSRLFPRVVFEGKPEGRYTSYFKIHFALGAAMSLASKTDQVDSEIVECRYRLHYSPKGRTETASAPLWSAELLGGNSTNN